MVERIVSLLRSDLGHPCEHIDRGVHAVLELCVLVAGSRTMAWTTINGSGQYCLPQKQKEIGGQTLTVQCCKNKSCHFFKKNTI
jgi:hypothetical protein